MAVDLSQQAVLGFLRSHGGSVKNSELLLHFSRFIRNNEDRDRNRDIFKKFVNTVATVRQEDGVSYVVLRKKFRVSIQSGGDAGGVSTGPPRSPAGRSSDLCPEKRNQTAVKGSRDTRRETPDQLASTLVPVPVPAGEPPSTTVLPAAGIIASNNNNSVGMVEVGGGPAAVVAPKAVVPQEVPRTFEHPVQREWSMVGQQSLSFGSLPETTVELPVVRHREGTRKRQNPQVLVPGTQLTRVAGIPGQEPSQQNTPTGPKVSPRGFKYRQSYKSAVFQDDEEEEEEEEQEQEATLRRGSAEGVWFSRVPLEDTRRTMSASSSCISESPAPPSVASSSFSSSSEKTLPTIYIQNVEEEEEEEEETLRLRAPETSSESGLDVGQTYTSEESTMSSRRRRPSDIDHHSPSPHKANKELLLHHDVHQGHQCPQASDSGSRMTRLSSSHSSIFSPPSSSDGGFSSCNWPLSGSSRGSVWNSSCEDLQVPPGGSKVLDVLQRSQRTKSATDLDRAETLTNAFQHNQNVAAHSTSVDCLHDNQDTGRCVSPWRCSTGEVNVDHEEVESSEGSAQQRTLVVRRLNSQLRSRMCVSLGADLDQLLQEEARAGVGGSEAARLNRLHLLSSSLSLRYNLSSSSLSSCSTPPRCQSLGSLVEGVDRGGGKEGGGARLPAANTTAQEQEGCRKSLVPLEPKEHMWLVKAAAGAWPDIYSLFREEPSLLNKHDFISGFTVLHWIAKHGDHRVLNTLWYCVIKIKKWHQNQAQCCL
ncbi:uncharacterized protein sowahb isoform X2 [Cynoglossus semilaevis]|uniref:uncharacterized protein sowahb isoform X2 n=1 Tax=Cynoglossus semilaevis TaxID=244447 RepID=UPI0004976F27|nr:uncharacterized protein LOC103389359 isoform X2 [Cynoglossus semilaevis]